MLLAPFAILAEFEADFLEERDLREDVVGRGGVGRVADSLRADSPLEDIVRASFDGLAALLLDFEDEFFFFAADFFFLELWL